MILTVTLNTSVDIAYVVDEFKIGGLFRTDKVKATAGGKGLNVSRVASLLSNLPIHATGFIGGHNGQYILDQLKNTKNIIPKFVEINGESRRCLNIIDSKSGIQTEILESGPIITQHELNKFIDVFTSLAGKYDVITMSGSMPKGLPKDTYARLIEIAKGKGAKVILDTSGQGLKEGIKAHPYLIKPNHDEAEDLLGMKLDTLENRLKGLKRLNRMADVVVMSLGKDGALIMCEGTAYYSTTPDIPVVNTVGSGDSMIAGFAVGFDKGLSIEDTIRMAMAAGTANAMNEQTGYFTQEDYDRVLPMIGIRKL